MTTKSDFIRDCYDNNSTMSHDEIYNNMKEAGIDVNDDVKKEKRIISSVISVYKKRNNKRDVELTSSCLKHVKSLMMNDITFDEVIQLIETFTVEEIVLAHSTLEELLN